MKEWVSEEGERDGEWVGMSKKGGWVSGRKRKNEGGG